MEKEEMMGGNICAASLEKLLTGESIAITNLLGQLITESIEGAVSK